jgi:hypothetical protein
MMPMSLRNACFCLAVVAVTSLTSARADDATRLLTETYDYCLQLQAMLDHQARHGPLPSDVQALADDGERMCRRGQIRGGITRLRRALIMLRQAVGGG